MQRVTTDARIGGLEEVPEPVICLHRRCVIERLSLEEKRNVHPWTIAESQAIYEACVHSGVARPSHRLGRRRVPPLADLFNLSPERVRQIEARFQAFLRHPFTEPPPEPA